MALIVQKYGGTSVGDIKRIKNVAGRIAKTYDQGNQVVVILSAMSGVTVNLFNDDGNLVATTTTLRARPSGPRSRSRNWTVR